MVEYFELSYGSNNRPRPHYPKQRRVLDKSLPLSIQNVNEKGKAKTVEYHIVGINNENVWKQVERLIGGEDVKASNAKDSEIINPLSFLNSKVFKYKESRIDVKKILMAGKSEYSSDIIGFCKPLQRGYYYHYGQEHYDYFNTGIQDPRRMWKVITEVVKNAYRSCIS